MTPDELDRLASEDDLEAWRLSNVNPRYADALWKRSLIRKRQASEMRERLTDQPTKEQDR